MLLLSVLGVIAYIMWSFHIINQGWWDFEVSKSPNFVVDQPLWELGLVQYPVDHETWSIACHAELHACVFPSTPTSFGSSNPRALWRWGKWEGSPHSPAMQARFSNSTTVMDPEALKESAPSKLLGMREYFTVILPLIPFFFRLHPWVLGQAACRGRHARFVLLAFCAS